MSDNLIIISDDNNTLLMGNGDIGDDFLSNMGFAEQDATIIKDTKKEKKTNTVSETVESENKTLDELDIAINDAVVIKASDRKANIISKNDQSKKANRKFGIKSNISISDSEYKSKTKSAPKHNLDNSYGSSKTDAKVITNVINPVKKAEIIHRTFGPDDYRKKNNIKNPNYKGNNTQTRNTAPIKKKQEKQTKVSETLIKKSEIILPESLTVKEFSEKMGISIGELIKALISNKMMLTLNSNIDYDTMALIATDFDIKVFKEKSNNPLDDLINGNLGNILATDKISENKELRPPIVTIMGHVDHGKTTLLDYLRKTTVSHKESGGITQSIGGSQVIYNKQKITFIDTPGHALFTSLRARGSKITDIVVIVIAADDGIKQQTIEAINHAKDSGCPIIVAITKIDKGIDNSDMIKNQMAEHDLVPEERGGDVPIVKVSGMTGQGVDDLLENILLFAEVSELYADPDRNGIGVILETHKDVQKGIITNMIVMTGRISLGDIVRTGSTYGKIKKMYNRIGKEIKIAHPGDPIMILGISDLPESGKLVQVVSSEKEAKENISHIINTQGKNNSSIFSVANKLAQGELSQLKLILKADSRGSLEALKQVIHTINIGENIEIKVIHTDVGNFYESDLDLAKISDAVMLGFNNDISADISKKANNLGVICKNFKIIYELADYLQLLVDGMVVIEAQELHIGKLEVLGVFFRKAGEIIFGGRVLEGEIRNNSYFRISRDEDEIISGKVTSLQKEQENVDKIGKGHECGMKAKCGKKIEVGDIVEYYVME